MRYPNQSKVSARLHDEALRSLHKLKDNHSRILQKIWGHTRRELRRSLYDAYKSLVPRGRWNLSIYHMSGVESHLRVVLHGILARFRALSTLHMRNGFKDLRWYSALRHGWVLDQVTPQSQSVKLPHAVWGGRSGIREAGIVKRYTNTAWDDRWSQWIEGYHSALLTNVRMEAVNESGVDDIMAEVDVTKVSTPASTLEASMSRLFNFESIAAIAAGEKDIADLNDDMMDTEIWRTGGGATVCDDCDANEGKTIEETDGDIPLHPNCECFWEMVPQSFASLLRSGSEEDIALANALQAQGLVPQSMIIRDEDGNISGQFVVSFEQWLKGQGQWLGSLQ